MQYECFCSCLPYDCDSTVGYSAHTERCFLTYSAVRIGTRNGTLMLLLSLLSLFVVCAYTHTQVMCGFLPASDSLPIFPASEHISLAGVSDHRKSQAIIDSLRRKVCMRPLAYERAFTYIAHNTIVVLPTLCAHQHATLVAVHATCSIRALVLLLSSWYILIIYVLYVERYVTTEYPATSLGIRSSAIICTGFT
jgi:hypothetical protein